jgi:opacity protein-like surface antigen
MRRIPLFLFLFIGVATLASAQNTTRTTTTTTTGYDDERRWEFSVQGQGIFPTNDDDHIQNDATYGANARLSSDLTPMIALGVEGGWMRFKDEVNGTRYGHINGFPLLADLIIKFPQDQAAPRFVPYMLGGVGGIWWNYDEDNNSSVKFKNDAQFAAKGGLGVDYYFNEQWALFLEGDYLFSKYESRPDTPSAILASKVDTNIAMAGVGLKVRF